MDNEELQTQDIELLKQELEKLKSMIKAAEDEKNALLSEKEALQADFNKLKEEAANDFSKGVELPTENEPDKQFAELLNEMFGGKQ